jgi:hypothetical protein
MSERLVDVGAAPQDSRAVTFRTLRAVHVPPRGVAAHLRQYGNGLAVKALKAAAGERASGLAATIEAIRGEGVTSANGIAKALNERSIDPL